MTGTTGDWRIGVDIGGTFTDLVLALSTGEIEVFKVPTVPEDPSRGALDAIAQAAASRGLSVRGLLERCSLFVHGSTVATNTLLVGEGARVGLLTTAGFRDAIEIRRGLRDNPWDHRTPYPPVLVPRHLRLPVRGRFDRHGDEVEALMEADVDAALEEFRADGVEAIAVCLFNSFLNPAHERRVAERIHRRDPTAMVSVSSAIAPVMGEYERATTAVLNAYVAPRTLSYLSALNQRLAELGLQTPLVLIQSNGGAVSVTELAGRSVTLLLSGPAAGVGALRYYCGAIGSEDLVSIEIGGTSCDVILMSEGRVASTDLLDIGGYKCVTPSVDVHTIGAGGGTLAHVDTAGLLQVGPRGAGARPGPACYGLGGREPTITDAQVVLGRLKPGTYANGAVTIDGDRAVAAIDRAIAQPLGLSVDMAAIGIIQLMEQKLLQAVQRVSTERGHNPDRLTLVAGGGAGPLHAASVARALNCARVYVPRLSGVFCALGMLNVNLQHDYVRVHLARLDDADERKIEAIFREMEHEAQAILDREGFEGADIKLTRAFDLRYLGQQWDVPVDVGATFDRAAFRAAFEAKHERLFGHRQPDGIVEITKMRVSGLGLIPPLAAARAAAAAGSIEAHHRRRVWIDDRHGWQEIDVYRGDDLAPGHTITGPAIIDERTTTILIGDGDALVVDPSANYSIALAA